MMLKIYLAKDEMHKFEDKMIIYPSKVFAYDGVFKNTDSILLIMQH